MILSYREQINASNLENDCIRLPDNDRNHMKIRQKIKFKVYNKLKY